MAALFGTAVGGGMDRLVGWVILPVTGMIPLLIRTRVLFITFAMLWAGFAIAVLADPSALDGVQRSINALPLVAQAAAWLLFLPLMAGLWVYSTDWPDLVRLGVVITIAAWNLVTFLPGREPVSPAPIE
jgi:hypothetical protein